MGFGDRLKELRDQAQQAVAENKDKIQGAVQTAGEAANAKTKGKYADKIAKVGERVTTGVGKFAAEGEQGAADGAPVIPVDDVPAAAETSAAEAAAAQGGSAPEFE